MDVTDRALLELTTRDAIGNVTDRDNTIAAVDDVLARLGWSEMLEAETRDAVDVVFTALGTTGAAATVLDDVVVAALGVGPGADVAVLLPEFGGWHEPGRIEASALHAVGMTTARVETAAEMIVVCSLGTELVRATVPVDAAAITPVRGVDPELGLQVVRIEHDASDATALDPETWAGAVAAGRRAVAHQISGACRTMLELARVHAIERVQFGRPVARFQAVRHRLAEALVAIEALEATLAAAWDEPGAMTAALAKALAGRAARTVGAHCQQVLAGTGFTMEHAFHRFLKRTMALDGLFGSADAIGVDLGHRLVGARAVPTLIEL